MAEIKKSQTSNSKKTLVQNPPTSKAVVSRPKKTSASSTVVSPAWTQKTAPVIKSAPAKSTPSVPLANQVSVWPWLWVVLPSLGGSLWWWWTLAKVLAPRQVAWTAPELLWYLSMALVAMAVMVGPAMLGGFVIRARRWIPLIGFLVSLQAVWFFAIDWATVVAIGSFTIGIWLASEGVRRETSSRLRLDIRSSLAHVMAWVILSLSIAVSVLHFSAAQQSLDPVQDVNRLITRVVSVSERLVVQFYPAYQPEMTIDELIGEQIPTTDELLHSLTSKTNWSGDERQQIIDRLSSLGISGLQVPPAGAKIDVVRTALDTELAAARGEMLKELRSGVSQQLGIELDGSETVHAALTRLADSRIRSRGSAFIKFLPPILSLSIFLALRLLSPLLELIVVAAGWLWYRILRSAHILQIRTEPAVAERLRWGSH